MFQIIRFYRDDDIARAMMSRAGRSEIITTVATKEEAIAWCTREDTQGEGWFDGWHEIGYTGRTA